MGVDLKRLKLLNNLISATKSAKFTFKASKANYLKHSGEVMSRDLFEKAMTHRLISEGQRPALASAVAKQSRELSAVSVKSLKKTRKDMVFRRVGGRIIPIRGGKK